MVATALCCSCSRLDGRGLCGSWSTYSVQCCYSLIDSTSFLLQLGDYARLGPFPCSPDSDLSAAGGMASVECVEESAASSHETFAIYKLRRKPRECSDRGAEIPSLSNFPVLNSRFKKRFHLLKTSWTCWGPLIVLEKRGASMALLAVLFSVRQERPYAKPQIHQT